MAVRARPSALVSPSRPSRPRRLQGDATYAHRHAKVSVRAVVLIARASAFDRGDRQRPRRPRSD